MDGKDGDDRVRTSNRRGDYQKAIEYDEEPLKIARKIGDQAGEGAAYGRLDNAYDSLGEYQTAIESHNKHCLLYTSPSPRDQRGSRMPSSA